MLSDRTIRLLAASIGAVIAAQGVWAFLAPRSFYDVLAEFEPFNAHFIRDTWLSDRDRCFRSLSALRLARAVVGLAARRSRVVQCFPTCRPRRR